MFLCAEPFLFDLFVVCTTIYHVVLSYFLCAVFSVGRLLLLRDRKSVSSCNLVCVIWFFSGVSGVRGALLIWP